MTRTLQTIYNVSKKVAVGYRPRILDYHKKNEVIMDADGICLPGNGPPTTKYVCLAMGHQRPFITKFIIICAAASCGSCSLIDWCLMPTLAIFQLYHGRACTEIVILHTEGIYLCTTQRLSLNLICPKQTNGHPFVEFVPHSRETRSYFYT
jgi:hypothetical protein